MYMSCVYHVHICLTYIFYSIWSDRAKALEIQKKKDREAEALKAKIAREKGEKKQSQIQEAKDKLAAKIAKKPKMIQAVKDKVAAIEQEKWEAKGMRYIVNNMCICHISHTDTLFVSSLLNIMLARAQALEVQKRKEREALEAKIPKKKEEEALAKVIQAAEQQYQYVLKEAEEAQVKRVLKALGAKIAKEKVIASKAKTKVADESAAGNEREKKLAEKKIAEEATLMVNIAMKELEQNMTRIEHARQVKMEVNEKFGTPSMKGPSLKLWTRKKQTKAKMPKINDNESRSEIEDVNVSSIEMDNARDVAPGVVDPEPEIMKQQILKLQSLISELKQPENPEVMKQEILQSLLSELKQSRYEDDEGLFSSLFKWPACFWEDLTNSSFDGSDYSTREGCRFTMVFSWTSSEYFVIFEGGISSTRGLVWDEWVYLLVGDLDMTTQDMLWGFCIFVGRLIESEIESIVLVQLFDI